MLAFLIPNSGDTSGKVTEVPKPEATEHGEALIRVLRAGVCNTDLEILKGYMGFRGILGHEFVGVVEKVCVKQDEERAKLESWIGKRVVGDINVKCDQCNVCTHKLRKYNRGADSKENAGLMARNHCPNRSVLGILNKDGTMAEFLTLPVSNLHIVPEDMSDATAVFSEPLAAACRIVEQGLVDFNVDKIAILGDGKLGLMIAEVLGRGYLAQWSSAGPPDHKKEEIDDDCGSIPPRPILFGKHKHKLDLVADSGVDCRHVSECYENAETDTLGGSVAPVHAGKYDVVVDATGSPAGLTLSSAMCRPMGTLVLKSTCAAGEQFNAAPFVIDELRVVGSRCGPHPKALELLSLTRDSPPDSTAKVKPLNVEKYITRTFPLSQAEDAIRCAAERSTMKVQIICSSQ